MSSGKLTEICVLSSTRPLAVGRWYADMSIEIELPVTETNGPNSALRLDGSAYYLDLTKNPSALTINSINGAIPPVIKGSVTYDDSANDKSHSQVMRV